MAEEVTLNQNYRAVASAFSTSSYVDAYDKAPGDAAYSDPIGMLIRQDAWFPSGSYLRWNIYRGFLYFDTSEIPAGAVITDAKLQMYVTHNYTYRTHSIIIQNGQPTYPTNPIGVWSYYHGFYSGNGGSIASSAISTNAWNTITLNDDGKSWINCGGETKLALRVSRDIESDSPGTPSEGAPAREEGIRLYSDSGVYAKLVITYIMAEVTTEAATEIAYECAMGNGTITGSNITERGFEIKLEYSGTLGNYVFHSVAGFEGDVSYSTATGKWEGTLIKTESEEGNFEDGAYELVLGHPSIFGNPDHVFNDKLFECESYTYRARATINGIVYYGDWVGFTTDCYPAGHQDDSTPPIDMPPIIPPPDEPIDIIVPPIEPPVFPPIEPPEMPPGYWSGMFYYRKAYRKKDLDELRRKCRIFLDNSVEYALVLNHNMRVLQQFLNYMHEYSDVSEFNGFKDLIPTQHLNALAHKELDVSDFKAIINNFISNSVNNTMNVNNNFRLIRNGLSDYVYSDDVGFIEGKVSTKPVVVNDPDVEMLKKKVDALSREMASNYATTQHNLYIVRAMIL